jgi:hypothetical protein
MHRKLIIRIVITVFSFALFSSCGAEAADRLPETSSVTTPTEVNDPVMQGAGPDQLEALADGLVTLDERAQAFGRLQDCLAEYGIEVTENAPSDSAGTSVRTSAPTGAEPATTSGQVHDCVGREILAVMRQWDFQNRPSPERLESARGALVSCLRDSGVPVPDGADAALLNDIALRTAPSEFSQCSRAVGEGYGLPGFAG